MRLSDLEVRLERPVANGFVLGHQPNGRVVLAEGGLPGERVMVRPERVRARLVQGAVSEVIEASPDRIAPPCSLVAAGCGGCDLQHLTPVRQPALKLAVVRDALVRLGRVPDPPVRAEMAGVAQGYRTTIRMAVTGGRLGFRRRGSHGVIATDRCLVAHSRLVELMATGRFDGAREVTLRLGEATGERLILADPTATGITGVPADVILVGQDELEAADRVGRLDGSEEPAVHEVVAGRRLRVSARSFFQAGPAGASALVDAVARAGGTELAGASVVVDAYAGVGLFSATLGTDRASRARWMAVERSPIAAADARFNLAGQDAEVITAAVEAWTPGSAEVVVADPARTGLGRQAVAVIAATGAAVVVLVSCDAASLGRDAALLGAHGFRLDDARVIDLFPQTHHLEVVSRFAR